MKYLIDDGVPVLDNGVIYEISKKGPSWDKWAILTLFCYSIIMTCFFLICMILEYKIIPRQCEIHGIFKFFLRVQYCTPNLFCLVDSCWTFWSIVYLELFHVCITWLCIWHDDIVQWAEKSDIYAFCKEGHSLRQIRYFNLVLGPKVSTCLSQDPLKFLLKLYMMIGYQSIKVK